MLTNQLWDAVLGELELTISKANFTTWFKNTFIHSVDDNSIVVGVPNAFTKAWLENKYHDHILTALNKSSQGKIDSVVYKVASNKEQNPEQIKNHVASVNEEEVVETNTNNEPVKTSAK